MKMMLGNEQRIQDLVIPLLVLVYIVLNNSHYSGWKLSFLTYDGTLTPPTPPLGGVRGVECQVPEVGRLSASGKILSPTCTHQSPRWAACGACGLNSGTSNLNSQPSSSSPSTHFPSPSLQQTDTGALQRFLRRKFNTLPSQWYAPLFPRFQGHTIVGGIGAIWQGVG